MPWIQNVGISDIKRANHFEAGDNSMLIQICDPAYEFPTPMKQFKEVHQFEFLDIEEDHEFACTPEQAVELVQLLQHALTNRMNVVVHCHAGVCRSGAVCEVGVMLGFNDTEVFRSPNLLVKHLMMKELGWTYDVKESHSINGAPVDEDWTTDNEKVFTLADARRKYRKRYEGDI
jgi:hypothetical protein